MVKHEKRMKKSAQRQSSSCREFQKKYFNWFSNTDLLRPLKKFLFAKFFTGEEWREKKAQIYVSLDHVTVFLHQKNIKKSSSRFYFIHFAPNKSDSSRCDVFNVFEAASWAREKRKRSRSDWAGRMRCSSMGHSKSMLKLVWRSQSRIRSS